jgi:hypothetical protein
MVNRRVRRAGRPNGFPAFVPQQKFSLNLIQKNSVAEIR